MHRREKAEKDKSILETDPPMEGKGKKGGFIWLIPSVVKSIRQAKEAKKSALQHKENIARARQMYSTVLPKDAPDIDFLNLADYTKQAQAALHDNSIKEKAMSWAENNFQAK